MIGGTFFKVDFKKTEINGLYIIERDVFIDSRGCFSRLFCQKLFEEKGINSNFVQTNYASTNKKNTLRGLHYQEAPSNEIKLITCISGRILDVAVDVRKNSPSYKIVKMMELTGDSPQSVIIPAGVAHGYLSLEDNVKILYQVTDYYNPLLEKGIRWNDSLFNISWPCVNPVLSKKDESIEDYRL